MTLRLQWRKHPARELTADTALAQAWDRLNAARLGLPFLDARAMGAALSAFGTGREQLLVAAPAAGAPPCAMLLLEPAGSLRWQTFQPSQIPLGAWVAELGLALPALARALLHGPLGAALVLSITQADPLAAPRSADEADTWHADYISTAWIELQGSFDDYWAARGKNLRQNLRKQRNRMATDGIEATLHVWQTPADVAEALLRYGALESAGWKAGQGTAIAADNAQGRFYAQLFEQAAQRGEARVYEYRFNGQPVAINLGLLRAGTLVVLKTTYDESQPKHLSPAQLLREAELQAYFAGSEVRRIEYYGKVMEWHTRLTENSRGLYHLTAYRWPWLKALATRRRGAADGAASRNTQAPSTARDTTEA
jgi:CelD/BcsL family acetyltransferase involved in cellulose biosynthesis